MTSTRARRLSGQDTAGSGGLAQPVVFQARSLPAEAGGRFCAASGLGTYRGWLWAWAPVSGGRVLITSQPAPQTRPFPRELWIKAPGDPSHTARP